MIQQSGPEHRVESGRGGESFKCYLLDTGLLISLAFDVGIISDEELFHAFLRGRLSINEGMFFENAVAQQLRASGHKLHFHEFYKKEDDKHIFEIDFILTKGRYICPIEVKSSVSNRHVSLDMFCEKYHNRDKDPVVIHSKDLRIDGGVEYLPVYMT